MFVFELTEFLELDLVLVEGVSELYVVHVFQHFEELGMRFNEVPVVHYDQNFGTCQEHEDAQDYYLLCHLF